MEEAERVPSTDEIEAVAEALWQADAIRATGRKRYMPWAEASEATIRGCRLSAEAAIIRLDQVRGK